MKKGALNSTSPFAFRVALSRLNITALRILRVDLHIRRTIQSLIRSDIARAHATGERPRLLDDEPNDARLARLRDHERQKATDTGE
jgi:hypothetical protein